MRAIDAAIANDWICQRLELSDSRWNGVLSSLRHTHDYRIPPDSGRKTCLARAIGTRVIQEGGLVLVTEFGIWPSAEDWTLFDGFRVSLGERRSLPDAPGHIFTAEEVNQLVALTCMVLYFCWGAQLVAENGRRAVAISHDESLTLAAASAEELEEMQGELQSVLGL